MILSNNEQAILNEFIGESSKRVYGREIAKRLNMNQKTVANVLNRLEKEHILKFSTEGKNKYYFLNQFNPNLKDIIVLIEIRRKIDFLERNKSIKEVFIKLEQKSQGILAIFGSYAKGKNTQKSDIDVLSLGKMEDIEELEEMYKIKINVLRSSKDKFNKQEPLIKEIINNHVVLKGAEEFVELLW